MVTQTEAEKIRASLKKAKNAREYARMMSVKMVRVHKLTRVAAASMLDVDRGTVSDWIKAYDSEGLDGLVDDARAGRPPFVTRDKLEKIIGEGRRFTAYKFVELVKKRTCVKYSETHARRLLISLGFKIKKTLRISNRVPPKEELEAWQENTKKEIETLENDGFTNVTADESHQNSNIFGSGAVYVRGAAKPTPMPLGNQRQTIYGGVTLDGQTCYMAANKANTGSFIRHLGKMRHEFGKVAVVVDNAAYHNSKRVHKYLKKNSNFVKLIFLPKYSPFLNPAEHLWRKGKVILRRTFRRPAKSYFRRKIMLVYKSFEITFDPRNILFRNLDKILPL